MKINVVYIALCFLSIVFLECKTKTEGGKINIQKIEASLQNAVSTGFSGSVLISQNNTILMKKGFGLADRENNISNSENTIFEVASVTKLFTVVAILQLAEKGKLSLDDYVNEYVGPFSSQKDAATIDHLLLNTAGLVPKGYQLDYTSKPGFLKSVKDAPMESIPGEKYRYTNAGYILLAAIIEKASNTSYENYLKSNIFEPLGLRHTFFGFEGTTDLGTIAKGYFGNTVDSLKSHTTPDYVWANRGPSGILSNVSDLHIFLEGLENKTLLSQEYLDKMFYEQMPGEAYGFHILKKIGLGKLLARGGGLPHFESQIAWYSDEGVKVIILINNHLGKRKEIWDQIEQYIMNQKE